MEKSGRFRWILLVIFLCMIALVNKDPGLALGPGADEDNFSLAGNGWTIHDDELIGSGPAWAGYEKSCPEGPFTLSFGLVRLMGGVHANINIDGPSRYAIGFLNDGNGSLSTYLFKQVGEIPPSSDQRILGGSMVYDPSGEYQIKIVSDEGRIQVFVDKIGQEKIFLAPMIDYYDSDPLPPGRIDFEALDGSSAHLNEVALACSPSRDEDKPPDLGVGYFKSPS